MQMDGIKARNVPLMPDPGWCLENTHAQVFSLMEIGQRNVMNYKSLVPRGLFLSFSTFGGWCEVM